MSCVIQAPSDAPSQRALAPTGSGIWVTRLKKEDATTAYGTVGSKTREHASAGRLMEEDATTAGGSAGPEDPASTYPLALPLSFSFRPPAHLLHISLQVFFFVFFCFWLAHVSVCSVRWFTEWGEGRESRKFLWDPSTLLGAN